MPNLQPNYPLRQDQYQNGSPAMSRYDSDSGVVETAAGIGFGLPVQRGVNPGGIGLLAAGFFLGIAITDPGVSGAGQVQGGDKYPQYKPAAYMTAGVIPVVCDIAIPATDVAVYFNTTTNRFTNTANSGANPACTGWVFETITTAAAQLVLIKRV